MRLYSDIPAKSKKLQCKQYRRNGRLLCTLHKLQTSHLSFWWTCTCLSITLCFFLVYLYWTLHTSCRRAPDAFWSSTSIAFHSFGSASSTSRFAAFNCSAWIIISSLSASWIDPTHGSFQLFKNIKTWQVPETATGKDFEDAPNDASALLQKVPWRPVASINNWAKSLNFQ